MEIIFRADGNSAIGLGHIMRSCALMQMLQNDFSCSFYTKDVSFFPYHDFIFPPLVKEVNYTGPEATAFAKDIPPGSVVVLDGYGFDTAYQLALKNEGHTVVCIDDIMQYHFVADVVINHAGGVEASAYSAEAYTEFCLGPAYALVKPLFYSEVITPSVDNKNLLISLGGADPDNHTAKVIDIVSAMHFKRVDVVLGAANKHVEILYELYKNNDKVFIHHALSSQQMYALMKTTSFAVLSPSTICYEYMSMGGVVFLYQIAGNQQHIKDFFLKEGLAFDFTEMGKVSEAAMLYSINKQKQIFDGKSAERFRSLFRQLQKKSTA